DTLDSMRRTAHTFHSVQPGRPIVFAFNKIDLSRRPDGADIGAALIDEFAGPVVRTNAATGEAVRSLFRQLGQRVVDVGA
ncbi:MAG: GTPase domain-containing protein, partial [Alphaproteobacteria bacterium]